MKYINLFLILTLVFSIFIFCTDTADAQSKIIKKTVKKVVKPQIAPVQPPKTEPTPEVTPVEPPPPPPPPTYEVQTMEEDKGLFGWGLNTDLSGTLLTGSGSLLGIRGNVIFSDPLLIGEKIGLAEDAVEYKVGLGFVLANDFNSIPLFMDAVVYLKEGSLFGMDPYVGTGLIYNLYGTGKVTGGLGGQIYLGILADLGFEAGKTGIAFGYGSYKVVDTHSADGIFLMVSQPIRL